MLSLDEAITHAREKAEKMYLQGMLCHANPNDDELDGCIVCAKEHEQLAEWLEELKAYREIGTVEGYKNAIKCYTEEYTIRKSNKQYNKAIDDFAELLKGNLVRKYANANLTQQYVALQVTDWCNEIAKQLKAGENQ